MSRHPARRARTATAVLSAAAFAGIAGGLAASHASTASAHPAATPTTVAPPGGASSPANADPNPRSDDGGWAATPAPAGSLGYQRQANHGRSGAS